MKHFDDKYQLIAAMINGEITEGTTTVMGAKELESVRLSIYINMKNRKAIPEGMTIKVSRDRNPISRELATIRLTKRTRYNNVYIIIPDKD